MRTIIAIPAVALAAALLCTAGPASAAGALGVWLTKEGRSHVTVAPCGDKLCGTITWLKEPLNDAGKQKLDINNPDDGLKSRTLIGLPLLQDFVQESETEWVDGTIYNPEDGETYSCTMTLEGDDTLIVRGYVGLPLFGKSQTWTRAK